MLESFQQPVHWPIEYTGKMRGIFAAWLLGGVLVAPLLGDDIEDAFDVGIGEWSASAGYGYRENVLFSEIAPVDSTFGYVSFEGIAHKEFTQTGGDWTSMALLDNRRYFQRSNLPDETFGLLLTEYGRFLTIDGRLTGGLQYVYFNQAFDATFDVLDLRQIGVQAQEPGVYLEWESFFWQFGYTAEAGFSRMYFEDSEDDYETLDWEFEADYLVSDSWSLTAALNGFVRDYTDRPAREISGARLDSVALGTDQAGIELALETKRSLWGIAGELEVVVDFEARRDRHFGFYDRDSINYGIEWRGGGENWNAHVDFGYAQRNYLYQTVENGSLRSSSDWVWSAELERDLNSSWAAFLRIDGDESDSNETFFSYEANTVLVGMRFK